MLERRTMGRRPSLSDSEPRMGEKKNCMSAKMVPNQPRKSAVRTALPWT